MKMNEGEEKEEDEDDESGQKQHIKFRKWKKDLFSAAITFFHIRQPVCEGSFDKGGK